MPMVLNRIRKEEKDLKKKIDAVKNVDTKEGQDVILVLEDNHQTQ